VSRRAGLTLLTVLLVAGLTTTLSALYLVNQTDKQFQFVRRRAETLNRLAADTVARAVESLRGASPEEAVRDNEELAASLLKIMSVSGSGLLEIAVCDREGHVLLSTDYSRSPGAPFPAYSDYRELAPDEDASPGTAIWRRLALIGPKLEVLRAESGPRFYQLQEVLAAEDRGPVLSVRVVVYPALIRQDVLDDLQEAGVLSLLSILGSIVGALVFSGYAFRPLSRVSQLLDNFTRGEYVAEDRARGGRQDEFGAVLSKVNLLGQQLGNFERFLDQLEEAILVFDRDRVVVLASGALEKFLRRKRAEVTGRRLEELFDAQSPVTPFLEQAAETGATLRDVRVRIASDLESGRPVHALLSVEPLAASERRPAGFLVRLRDPEVRRQLEGQLQLAGRLTAISRVTSGVAHEVKNPLNAMRMHLELAKLKLARGDAEVQPQLEVIAGEILRLDRVVKTFLDFNRPLDLKLAETPLDGLVEGLAALTRPQAEAAGVRLETAFEARGAVINADPDLLKQALLNLVVNAIEAMPGGGVLRLETGVRAPSGDQGEEVEIRIRDTGAGIPPEVEEKIFQLFFTTKERGSGIGLALTYRMVQLHGGRIGFSSKPGQGTTFVVCLPLAGALV
jgi:signal transduction histidine kinase